MRAAMKAAPPVYVIGGYQTDYAKNWARSGKALSDLVIEAVQGGLSAARVDAHEVDVAHVGNFVAELFAGQGNLGGLFVEADPAFSGLPTARHEAACASGGVALLAATAEIEAGRYDVACVLGVELMRNVPGDTAAQHLAAAAWHPRETEGVRYVWPQLFSDLGDEYERRYGPLRREHLAALAKNAFANAKKNPNAQARGWSFDEASFGEDDAKNPVIAGRIRKQDCSQVTDGAAVVFLASARYARAHADRVGRRIEDVPLIKGWGHRTARMALRDKLAESRSHDYVFPHVRGTITDALERAGIGDVLGLSAIETHDCFTTTHYMAIDHFGITAPGESWKAIEDGTVLCGGSLPVNPSGGLTGVGHPVGATGVRMLLDAAKQVTGTAGDYQVPGARDVATLNLGGSATAAVSFVVGRAS